MVDVLTPVAVLIAVTLTPGIFAWLTSETTPVIDPIACPNAFPEKTTNTNSRINNNDLNLIFVPPYRLHFLVKNARKHCVHTSPTQSPGGKYGLEKNKSQSLVLLVMWV